MLKSDHLYPKRQHRPGSGKGQASSSPMPVRRRQEYDASVNCGSDEVYKTLDKDMKRQREMKKHLMEIYENTASLFNSETMMEGLREIMTETKVDYLGRVAANRSKLESEECPIVIAGETSGGKSSLINLLIGEEILPYSVLQKTVAICCLHHSDEKYIIYERSGITIKNDFEQDSLAKTLNAKLDALMEDDNIKLIDVYWPIALLKNQVNVILVDTPGLGDNEEMVDILLKYLPNAVAFIYVINTANAGGIENNKILRILERQLSLERNGESFYDISSTIFVCNKWDQVPAKEDEKVMKYIQHKLTECMALANKRIDIDKQVLRFSASKALVKLMDHNEHTEDFDNLLKNIMVLVPSCLERKCIQLYSWLRKSLLENMYQTASTHLRYAWTPLNERRKLQKDVGKRLDKLRVKCKEVREKMEKEGNDFCINIAKKLHRYLHSKEVTKRLSTWDENLPPSRCDNLVEDIEKAIKEKIGLEIGFWQTNEDDFQNSLRNFKADCSKMYGNLQNEIETVRLMMEGAGRIGDLPKIDKEEEKGFFDFLFGGMGVGKKVAAAITSPLWVPIALVIGMVAIPVIGIGGMIKAFAKDAICAIDNLTLRKE